jgi:hypothetical protein
MRTYDFLPKADVLSLGLDRLCSAFVRRREQAATPVANISAARCHEALPALAHLETGA